MNPLIDITRDLSLFSHLELLQANAALQLMPDNAERAVRLEAFAYAATSLPVKGTTTHLNLQKLKKLLRPGGRLHTLFASQEDPSINPFTEALTFHGGSFIVFPGIVEDATFSLSRLAEALFLHPKPLRNSSFGNDARAVIAAILAISNEMAQRADLGRGVEPAGNSRKEVILPTNTRFEQLKQAATFSPSEIVRTIASQGAHPAALKPLITPAGRPLIESFNPSNHVLLHRPIVKVGDQFVVALPNALLAALRHELMRLAVQYGVEGEVAQRFHEAIWRSAVNSFVRLGNEPMPYPLPTVSSIPSYTDALLKLDTDKQIYVGLLTDPLTDYNIDDIYGQWSYPNLREQIEERVREVESRVLGIHGAPNELLIMLLVQGVGRTFALGFKQPSLINSPFLSMSASALDTISLLEWHDPLLLWKYGSAAWHVREQTKILSFNELDEFNLYRSRGYSYYLSDEARPTLLVVHPDGAGVLRRKVQHERDYHAVPSYQEGLIAEVTTLFDTAEIPVYVTLSSVIERRIEMLVESLPLPVWVTDSESDDGERHDLQQLYWQFGRAITYWLWQCSLALETILSPVAERYPYIHIELLLHSDEGWHRHVEANGEESTAITVRADKDTGTLNVYLRSSITTLLESSDNAGERELMRRILAGLRELLLAEDQLALSDEALARILDVYAPLGIKKMILYVREEAMPDLNPEGLSTYRKLQQADENELLDELGDYLTGVEGLQLGRIPRSDRTSLLQKVVSFYYQELERLVATLRPDGLLEWLIRHQEAVLREAAFNRLTIPTRLACFGEEEEIAKELREAIPERTYAGVASRFIIEYVVARPPAGLRPISMSVYDRLQALAAHIANFGFESDQVYFKLAEIDYAMLASGRLGANRDAFLKAREAYLPTVATGEISRATRSFGSYWRQPESERSADRPDFAVRLDAAFDAEFGVSLTDTLSFMDSAYVIGSTLDLGVARVGTKDFINRITTALGWDRKKVEHTLEMLSLRPRTQFLNPPRPHRKEDVYPWRFNRSLSYVRRPFLQSQHNGRAEIFWGNRNLYQARINLVNLCRQGRIVAHSIELRRMMGEINRERGDAFNNKVAEVYEKNPDLIVRRRTKKFGHLKLNEAGNDLGDVDVLVIDRWRRRIKVIECKDLALARTPYEMASEIINLFRGSEEGKPIVERHQRRVSWIQQHIGHVVQSVGIEHAGKWKAEGLIVVDQELFTPYLERSKMKVTSLERVSDEQA